MVSAVAKSTAANIDKEASAGARTVEARTAAKVFSIDPVQDPRWPLFLQSHPGASVFHTPGWLAALQRTYAYEPTALTTSAPGHPLENGIVFCRVRSWLTGYRLVSLPFSDHCQPLVRNSDEPAVLLRTVEESARQDCRYVELRPLAVDEFCRTGLRSFERSNEYYFHSLDLRPDLDVLFRRLHKSCIQRKIRRAEREGLTYEAGRSESILSKFYRLQVLTRRRHQLPPQPITWFRNLVDCIGDKLTIRVLSKDDQPLAGILTLSFKSTWAYKYGCSDARLHSLGGMPLLFWKAIEEGKRQGVEEFDLGRSEIDNPGLTAFKGHLGATQFRLTYFRLHSCAGGLSTVPRLQLARRVFARIPHAVAERAGTLLYRHMG